MLICHLYTLFNEVSFHVFCPFSNWIVCFFTVERVLTKVSLFNIHFGIPDVLNKNSDQMDAAYENG